ncbi:MAG: HU family DNA-binding protein [Firmicutes bacterium]|nr:HU family DNA-binding protein [Bacillota bacterium]
MKKADFVAKLSKKIKKTRKETNMIVDEISELITQTLKRGDEVGLPLGKFQLKKRSSRIGFNPRTKQQMAIAPKVIPAFKPSKKFKEAVLE